MGAEAGATAEAEASKNCCCGTLWKHRAASDYNDAVEFSSLLLSVLCYCTRQVTSQPLTLATMKTALQVLQAELEPAPPSAADPNFVVADPTYRRDVGVALFYKFFLSAMVKVDGR